MKRRKRTRRNKSKRWALRFFHTWIANRRGVFIAAILVAGAVIAFETNTFVGGNTTQNTPGWIIDGNQLKNLVGYGPSALPQRYFNTANTIIMNEDSNPGTYIPNGWHSQAGNHYTSYGTNSCTDENNCYSLLGDITQNNGTTTDQARVALYDDEYWPRTPATEQSDPCGYMSKFVVEAHLHGLTTIVAPDQDLAEPNVITSYQGGETENWQAYLRIGLASCAASTGSEWYHIMSQPFESNWCSNPFEECESSESDYDNFVTQAALQAKAVNPSIKLSDGLSTNPDYFGFFRGTQMFAKTIYQDYVDTKHTVDAVWMNIIGHQGNLTTLYFLGLLSRGAQAQPRSSVWFLEPNNVLQNSQSSNAHTQSFSLSLAGNTEQFVSNQTIRSKVKIPAGTGEFQFWTDGSANQSATVTVTFGYCSGKSCSGQVTLASMNVNVMGGVHGAAVPSGAFTTDSNTTLPNKGPYHLFVRVTVAQSGSFNLLYGDSTPTNMATPVVLPIGNASKSNL